MRQIKSLILLGALLAPGFVHATSDALFEVHISFNKGSANLTDEAKKKIDLVREKLSQESGFGPAATRAILVCGYAEMTESQAAPLALTRAARVRQHLDLQTRDGSPGYIISKVGSSGIGRDEWTVSPSRGKSVDVLVVLSPCMKRR